MLLSFPPSLILSSAPPSLSLSPLSFSCSSFTGMTIWIAPFSLTIPLSICRRSSLLAYAMHSAAAAAAATTWSSCWRLMYQTSTASIAHRWDSRFQLPLPATLRNDASSCTSSGIINQRHNPLIWGTGFFWDFCDRRVPWEEDGGGVDVIKESKLWMKCSESERPRKREWQ